MKSIFLLLLLALLGCNSNTEKSQNLPFSHFETHSILNDSVSIRAIQIIGNNLAFAGNNGIYGLYNSRTGKMKRNIQKYDSTSPEFRAVASTTKDFFMLSVGNPALLYKTGEHGNMELVYKEENDKVFYDALAFWNDKEGIAMGDPTDSCISLIITRDGGNTWKKLNCESLPRILNGEAAFAASNSNIAIQGDNTWILTGGMQSRVYFSPDKGKTWNVYDTPLINGKATTGGYSMDFYDAKNGIILGGDYTNPDGNTANKAITNDGGKTWKLVANGKAPGYKSCVRYVPGKNGKQLVAVGFSGISSSNDYGKTWKTLSSKGFYTLRFLNDSTAYAAGKNQISILNFFRKK